MQIKITGKHIDIGESLHDHAEQQLKATVNKYIGEAIEGKVVIGHAPHHKFAADVSVYVGHGINVKGHAVSDDAYPAVDAAISRIETQLKKYKARLKHHHRNQMEEKEALMEAQQYTLAAEDHHDEESLNGAKTNGSEPPAIIAEELTNIPTLTVSEAVMRMDLADTPAFMFKNKSSSGLNVVYRRPDGNIGWIDPTFGNNKQNAD